MKSKFPVPQLVCTYLGSERDGHLLVSFTFFAARTELTSCPRESFLGNAPVKFSLLGDLVWFFTVSIIIPFRPKYPSALDHTLQFFFFDSFFDPILLPLF